MLIRLLALFIAVASGCIAEAPVRADAIDVHARFLLLDAADPDRTRVGRLEWRGGLALTSPDSRFGGLSSLRVAADGLRFTAISDEGWRVDGRMLYDAGGRLAGVDAVTLVPLLSRRGRPLPELGKYESDGRIAPHFKRVVQMGFELFGRDKALGLQIDQLFL